MAISEAKKISDARWRKKAYDRIAFDVRKDAEINSDVIRRFAERKGMSVNGLIKLAISEMIYRDEDFVI